MSRAVVWALMFTGPLLPPVAALAAPDPEVITVGDLATPRAAHRANLLADGEVLISGGCTATCDRELASTERYDPRTRRFRPAATLHAARSSHAAATLGDGRVLIAGGWSAGEVIASAELYEPAADRFVAAGSLGVARAGPGVASLPDGRVLLAGGQTSALEPLASAEIFDPRTRRFAPTGAMTVARMNHAAVTLADGRVLVVGGRGSRRGATLSSAELFDPRTGKFRRTGDLLVARHKHAAVRLPDGRVLVVGGSDARDDQGRLRSTELFDPVSGRFTPGPDLRTPRFKIGEAVAVLATGRVVMGGGGSPLERFDARLLSTRTLTGGGERATELGTALRLADDTVLLTGGYDQRIRTQRSAWLVRVAD